MRNLPWMRVLKGSGVGEGEGRAARGGNTILWEQRESVEFVWIVSRDHGDRACVRSRWPQAPCWKATWEEVMLVFCFPFSSSLRCVSSAYYVSSYVILGPWDSAVNRTRISLLQSGGRWGDDKGTGCCQPVTPASKRKKTEPGAKAI